MLHILHDVVFRLLFIMMLSSLLELLLPEDGARPFVRLVLGMIVLAVCLEPFLQFPAV